MRGTADSYWTGICLSPETPLTEVVILQAFRWWETILTEPDSVSEYGYLLFELFSCRDNLNGRHSSAWPRPMGFKHLMLLGAGCKPNSPREQRERAKAYLINGPKQICGKAIDEVDIVPNVIEEFHSIEKIYGEHYEKLRKVKRRVDPRNRLQGWIRP